MDTNRLDLHIAARDAMVDDHIAARGIDDPRVLCALRAVPRHEFVSPDFAREAYEDHPLPIGGGQTISQPYVVAAMSAALRLRGTERVLEVGAGCGYQTAVLATLAREVVSIEIVPRLAELARSTLARLGYANARVREGDGWRGWPELAPFDAILVAAAPERVPEALLAQLQTGGRMVLPVGGRDQELVVVAKTREGVAQRRLFPVRFVPMTGGSPRA